MNITGMLETMMYSTMKNQRTSTGKSTGTGFADIVDSINGMSKSQIENYTAHLKEKYGIVRVENVPKDQKSLDKIAGTMSGGDVVIAPNMLQKMAEDPNTASRIEGIIDNVHDNIPTYTAEAATMGLTFESLGVIVHEDGTVTHICGGGDSPERVAEVNHINREKRGKRTAEMKANEERAHQRTVEARRILEESLRSREMVYNNFMSTSLLVNHYMMDPSSVF